MTMTPMNPLSATASAQPRAVERRGEKPVPLAPLGPDSLTWKYFGDLRTGMMGVWIGAIQNMYPELGAGVEEHSILLREPLQRIARSVYPIMGVVYDGKRAATTGEQIKRYHHTIKGVDASGRRYLHRGFAFAAQAEQYILGTRLVEVATEDRPYHSFGLELGEIAAGGQSGRSFFESSQVGFPRRSGDFMRNRSSLLYARLIYSGTA